AHLDPRTTRARRFLIVVAVAPGEDGLVGGGLRAVGHDDVGLVGVERPVPGSGDHRDPLGEIEEGREALCPEVGILLVGEEVVQRVLDDRELVRAVRGSVRKEVSKRSPPSDRHAVQVPWSTRLRRDDPDALLARCSLPARLVPALRPVDASKSTAAVEQRAFGSSGGFAAATDPYTASVASRRSGERRLACRGEKQEEETRRPSMAAKGLLTRGPKRSEPPEAHPQSVPVGKRRALKGQEKVAPRRAGIRATCRSRSAAARAVPEGG